MNLRSSNVQQTTATVYSQIQKSESEKEIKEVIPF